MTLVEPSWIVCKVKKKQQQTACTTRESQNGQRDDVAYVFAIRLIKTLTW